MRHLDNLTGLDKEMLLNWFLYHMPMEQRRRLMREMPVVYNKVVDAPVVEVYTQDGERL